jgi:hypothetical protein
LIIIVYTRLKLFDKEKLKKILILLLLLSATASSQANIFGKVFAKSLQTDGVTIDSTYYSAPGSMSSSWDKDSCNLSIQMLGNPQNIGCIFHGTITNRFKNRTVTQVIVTIKTYGCPDECSLYDEDKVRLLWGLNEEIPPGGKRTFAVRSDYNRTPNAVRRFSIEKVKGYK